jgi:tellurium resistance protein TerZ
MIELTRGQEIVLAADDGTPLHRITMGIGWAQAPNAGALSAGSREVDLDASAVQFANRELFDLAFYNNLRTRDGSVVHLGDNRTGHGEGDDETITVDLDKVYERVDAIVLLVSSYQGQSLEWISRAYCRVLDEDDAELARFTLTLGVSDTGLVMATLVRAPDGWRLRAVGEGVAVRRPSESTAKLRRFV